MSGTNCLSCTVLAYCVLCYIACNLRSVNFTTPLSIVVGTGQQRLHALHSLIKACTFWMKWGFYMASSNGNAPVYMLRCSDCEQSTTSSSAICTSDVLGLLDCLSSWLTKSSVPSKEIYTVVAVVFIPFIFQVTLHDTVISTFYYRVQQRQTGRSQQTIANAKKSCHDSALEKPWQKGPRGRSMQK